MNSKGHLIISFVKSGIRIISSISALIIDSITPLAIGIIIAEITGILEETVDKR